MPSTRHLGHRFAPPRSGCRPLVTAMLLATIGCGGAGETTSVATPPNVVLIVIDCLRADHVGAYGYPKETTPRLDRLVSDAVLFEHAIAQSNWTKPAMASLLTGTLLSQHLLTEGRLAGRSVTAEELPRAHVLSGELVTLAEALSGAGFVTRGFVNQGHLAAYMGFAQGFDEYAWELTDGGIVRSFGEWLEGLEQRPFFAYLHFLELHYPYRPSERADRFNDDIDPPTVRELMDSDPERLRELADAGDLTDENVRELRGLYDGDLFMADAQLGRALGLLREHDLYEDALVVVTADHGEALLERGAFEHGAELLTPEVLNIPLVFKLPGQRHAGRRVADPAQSADVMPTILELAGIEPPPGIGGRSLVGLVEGTAAPHSVLAELSDLEGSKALFYRGYKFVFHADPTSYEVYDFRADPRETTDLRDRTDPELVAAARAELIRLLDDSRELARQVTTTAVPLEPAELEKLRALGYIR